MGFYTIKSQKIFYMKKVNNLVEYSCAFIIFAK